MRVLFVVTGFGYGDSVRINTILDEMEHRIKDLNVMFMGYENSYEFFSKKYITLKIRGYNFPDYNLEFKTTRFFLKNITLPARWMADYLRHKKTIKKFDPDIVISDFEPLANIIARKIGKRCISIFGYDPKLFEKYPDKNKRLELQAKFIEGIYKKSDVAVVPTFKAKENYENIRYVGPIVRLKPDDLPPKQEIMTKLKMKKEPIVVMLGGSDYGVNLAKKILKTSQEFNEDFIIFGSKKKIAGLHFRYAKNFLEYLKVSKAVITLGGKITLSECLVFKKPMLIFPIKNHVEQMLNAYALRNVSLIGDPDDISGSINDLLSNLSKLKEKLDMVNAKGDGAKQFVDILLDEAKAE